MKKGFVGLDWIQWILRIIFLTVVVFACVFLIRMLVKNDVNIIDAEIDLFFKRVIYTPNGIMLYKEEIDRNYPGIVDLDRFKNGEELLNRAIDYGDPNYYVAAKVWLYDTNPDIEEHTFYYNSAGYNKWRPLFGIPGQGGVEVQEKVLPVLVYDKGNVYERKLKMDVVTPRT